AADHTAQESCRCEKDQQNQTQRRRTLSDASEPVGYRPRAAAHRRDPRTPLLSRPELFDEIGTRAIEMDSRHFGCSALHCAEKPDVAERAQSIGKFFGAGTLRGILQSLQCVFEIAEIERDERQL